MRSMHREIPVLLEPRPWTVEERGWTEETNKKNETVFTVANGYIGMRGFFEEGYFGDAGTTDPTTMLNGVYEYFPYHHIWCRPGFPERYHAIVAQANPFSMEIYADGERVGMRPGRFSDELRVLDMRDGRLTRSYTYRTESGTKLKLTFERFASQAERGLAACRLTLETDTDVRLEIRTSLLLPGAGGTAKEEIGGASGSVFELTGRRRGHGASGITYRTKASGYYIACAAVNLPKTRCKRTLRAPSGGVAERFACELAAGGKFAFERTAVFASGLDGADWEACAVRAAGAVRTGFDALLAGSKKVLNSFWENTDIRIEGDELIQQGLRFSAFQIFQSTGRDGFTNISANGLSGTGYSGHTFWDTEIFMLPMYLYTDPETAKQLILYRYHILDKARERARQMEDRGALYAWNSINGEECGHVFEAVTAQYHIDCDVFYAIYRYFEATGDEKFLRDYCAEILFELAKCMSHRGSFIPMRGGKFCINVVCGPDEYNPIVDNNMYTNLLTKKMFEFTLEVRALLARKTPEKLASLEKACGMDETEFSRLREAAEKMYLPYSEQLGMYMQDDNFLYKDPIDVDAIPRDRLPLLTHLHPLNLWRYQVCKQADLVLLTFLCSDWFSREQRKRIFEFYEPRTIHDSSLSASIHSIVACDVGERGEAYGYLRQAARMDLDDVNRNTFFGLHAACMGASWMMVVNGYAGLRIYDGLLHFEPFLDEKWRSCSFRLLFRGSRIEVRLEPGRTVYRLLSGGALDIVHFGRTYTLSDELTLTNGEE